MRFWPRLPSRDDPYPPDHEQRPETVAGAIHSGTVTRIEFWAVFEGGQKVLVATKPMDSLPVLKSGDTLTFKDVSLSVS